PRGIEILVKKASVDHAFRSLLIQNRSLAARDIGLELDPSESLMLDSAPPGQLASIIDNTRVHPRLRPALMGTAAAIMISALTAALTGCDTSPPPVTGISPDIPDATSQQVAADEEPPPPAPEPMPVAGIMVLDDEQPAPPPATRGIQPDMPKSSRDK
ncbi:MAG: hypothetical protein JW909_13585, partial [Planctomycetes bacterium]|nr:hypothetical protein [Planctomycetota bacterium]